MLDNSGVGIIVGCAMVCDGGICRVGSCDAVSLVVDRFAASEREQRED